MVNYQLGKVYKITSPQTDKVYIGSTAQVYLSSRLTGHVRDFKMFEKGKGKFLSSFEIIKFGDAIITLLEDYKCETKEQLLRKEREWIEKTTCVNKNIPTRTYTEYYTDNKQTILANQKQYRVDNQQMISAYKKQYYADNKQMIIANQKQYRADNKETILTNKSTIVVCPFCKSNATKGHLARHQKSQKCKILALKLAVVPSM
jgi:hypothetical protein